MAPAGPGAGSGRGSRRERGRPSLPVPLPVPLPAARRGGLARSGRGGVRGDEAQPSRTPRLPAGSGSSSLGAEQRALSPVVIPLVVVIFQSAQSPRGVSLGGFGAGGHCPRAGVGAAAGMRWRLRGCSAGAGTRKSPHQGSRVAFFPTSFVPCVYPASVFVCGYVSAAPTKPKLKNKPPNLITERGAPSADSCRLVPLQRRSTFLFTSGFCQ